MQRLSFPLPLFAGFGAFLEAGYIYVGTPDSDPTQEVNQFDLFLDQALTQPIEQPLRTLGGFVISGANAVNVYLDEDDYAITVQDANGQLVVYEPSSALAEAAYQPLSETLTALAALATTAFGRNLLTLANQAALQTALGLPAALPLIGGTMTGNIVRQGAGTHLYHADDELTSGRVFVTEVGAADPTSLPGDIWLEVEA